MTSQTSCSLSHNTRHGLTEAELIEAHRKLEMSTPFDIAIRIVRLATQIEAQARVDSHAGRTK